MNGYWDNFQSQNQGMLGGNQQFFPQQNLELQNQGMNQQGFQSQPIDPMGGGQGFDWSGAAQAGGSLLQGAGSLANAWAGLQGIKLAKDQLATQNAQFQQNFEAQRTTTNNRIGDQNAWKRAQGRSDQSRTV